MYAGQLVETAPTGPLFSLPIHPYTRGLLASVPTLTGDPSASLSSIEGQPPDRAALPPGCPFAPRCDYAEERCQDGTVPLEVISGGDGDARSVACHLSSQIAAVSGGAL